MSTPESKAPETPVQNVQNFFIGIGATSLDALKANKKLHKEIMGSEVPTRLALIFQDTPQDPKQTLLPMNTPKVKVPKSWEIYRCHNWPAAAKFEEKQKAAGQEDVMTLTQMGPPDSAPTRQTLHMIKTLSSYGRFTVKRCRKNRGRKKK